MTHYPDGSVAQMLKPHPIYNPPPSAEQIEIARLKEQVRRLTVTLVIVLTASAIPWIDYLVK